MSQGAGMFLAKALFDNVAETPDELAFRRGDVLTVLEQDCNGLEGWWLCTLRGKHGIAPGNRLKILSGMGVPDGKEERLGNGAAKSGMELYDQPSLGIQQDYDVPPSHQSTLELAASSAAARRASRDSLNHSRSRGASLGDDLYDTPPSSKRGSAENATAIYDTPPSSKRASSERTPPHSNRSSASRDSGSNLLSARSPSQSSLSQQQQQPQPQHNLSSLNLSSVVKRRSGSQSSDNCYETPPGSNRSSLERILSEEGPPIYDTLSPATSVDQLDGAGEATYDTPPVRNNALSFVSPTSQSSLRSVWSSESLLSNTSGTSSTRLSQTTSLPDSARSSMDLPADTYDVPPPLRENDKSRKQLSMDSGLGFYDSPVKSRPTSSSNAHSSSEGLKTSHSSFECKPSTGNKDMKRSKSLEHALDDLYDVPKNNAPKVNLKSAMGPSGFGSNTALNDTGGVYDIPPQVTRDSVISMRSDSSDENQRLSSSSLDLDRQLSDVPAWDELLLDLESALELLVKRQQDVNKATARLAGFVNNSWRTRASLEKTLYDIKVSCSLVNNSLHDFVDFAHGAVANASKLPDRPLANRLHRLVSPLQSTLDFVNRSFSNLEEMKWQVSLLSEPLDKTKNDDLGQIALVARDLMPEVKKVSSFIQSNSSSLFKRASSGDSWKQMSSKPPIVPKAADGNGAKGYSYGLVKPKTIQHRPLPAVPGTEKLDSSLTSPITAAVSGPKRSIYDIKAALHQDDYAECDEVVKKAPNPVSSVREVMVQCAQEYDYVQLDSRDSRISPDDEKSESKNSDVTKLADVTSGTSEREIGLQQKDHSFDGKVDDGDNSSVVKPKDIDDYNIMDMIPVKESSSRGGSGTIGRGSGKDISSAGADSQNNSSTSNIALDAVDSPVGGSLEAEDDLEPDLKTPVNMNDNNFSACSTNFPTPPPSLGASTSETLEPGDRQVLSFYTDQLNSHSTLLANAIDAFIEVVGENKPPKVFISHSKFVIVSAHKLVHIGDSIHRSLISNGVSARIMQCANHLCDCLKASVTATKTAALQYPSVPAVQEMVDRVVAVSHAAHELKLVVTQAGKN